MSAALDAPAARPRVNGWRQLRGVLQLAGSGVERIAAHAHAFHRAIADIPFDSIARAPLSAPVALPTRLVHDGVTAAAYGIVGAVGGAAFQLGAAALAVLDAVPAADMPAVEAPALDDAVSALNGIVGDFMATRRNPLAIRLGFYASGVRLVLTREALATVHPCPTDRLAIFVHGLCCNETVWARPGTADDPDPRPYAERLADGGLTPYFVRYNTGLHVSQNGRLLARALSRLVAAHPRPVREIVLIGHSMGGLVVRAACAAAIRSGASWGERVSHVLCLGAPHLGAPLERAVHAGTTLMRIVPLARPWAELLNARSRGIQDLRYGFTADADWRRRDPQRHYRGPGARIPRLPAARYHFIGSSMGTRRRDVLDRLFGDGLVRLSSSTARELADADTAVCFRVHHLALLNHPAVYAEIRRRIAA